MRKALPWCNAPLHHPADSGLAWDFSTLGRLVHVSYTFRGDLVRIVSARGAEPYEQRLYHEANP
jgi:hypothetical protein